MLDDSAVASRTQVDATSTKLPIGTKVSIDGDSGLSSATTQSVKQPTTTTDKDDDTVMTETDVTQGTTNGSETSAIAGHHGSVLLSKPMTIISNSATATGIESTNVATNDGTESPTATLPQTGEHGATLVSALGVVLLAIAGWLGLTVKQRREN